MHHRAPGLGRRDLLHGALVAAVGGRVLAAAPAALAASATADQALDVQMLQTAASIENVAVAAYDAILGLPLLTGSVATPALKQFLNAAHAHHIDHARAFNDAATKLGGRAQTGSNPGLAAMVSQERARLGDLASVVELALTVETTAAQTYQNNVAAFTDANARRLSASILGVEAQHTAMLLICRHLAAARMPDLITDVGPVAPRLPADAGRVGFPDSFSPVDRARPPAEGAVR
jgi:ferritin-like protein